MGKRKDQCEEWAIKRLEAILELDRADRDALPGSAVKHMKAARDIMRKRRRT